MSKFVGVIIGGLEIAVGIASEILLPGNPLGIYLIASGVGMVLTGIGTLLSQGQLTGTATLSPNPIAPWHVVDGRQHHDVHLHQRWHRDDGQRLRTGRDDMAELQGEDSHGGFARRSPRDLPRHDYWDALRWRPGQSRHLPEQSVDRSP